MSEANHDFKIRSATTGNWEALKFDVAEYHQASKQGLTLPQYLSRTHGDKTDEAKYGSVIGQMMQSAGLFLGEDVATGIKAPSMSAIFDGSASVGSITRPDGSQRNSPSGRLLFPAIIMAKIESELRTNSDDFLSGWENLIAITNTITGPKFDQPIINVKAPEGSASNSIAQMEEPDAMIGISVSDYSRSIPTKSIGLLISDQAMAAATLDLVGLAVSAQARGERIRMVENQIKSIVAGDTDLGEAALPTTAHYTFDTVGVTTKAMMSQLAWVKYLRQNYQKRTITNVITSIDAANQIEGRKNRPDQFFDFGQKNNFPVDFTIDNLSANSPRVLLVDPSIIGADMVIGLDRRYAIRRVINVAANYSAIENFVMRRATGMRFDYGEIAHRLYDDAFDVMKFVAP